MNTLVATVRQVNTFTALEVEDIVEVKRIRQVLFQSYKVHLVRVGWRAVRASAGCYCAGFAWIELM